MKGSTKTYVYKKYLLCSTKYVLMKKGCQYIYIYIYGHTLPVESTGLLSKIFISHPKSVILMKLVKHHNDF